ncbi:MAG TPA: hypothetical protein VNC61_04880 [Acidimicrobiales bacterium]|nr:hypothetical protein [Acidimicrobiales bacterium]
MAERPMGPAPTTATTSPGETASSSPAHGVAGGQDVGQREELPVGPAGRDGEGRGVGEGDRELFGPGALDGVAENPFAAEA